MYSYCYCRKKEFTHAKIQNTKYMPQKDSRNTDKINLASFPGFSSWILRNTRNALSSLSSLSPRNSAPHHQLSITITHPHPHDNLCGMRANGNPYMHTHGTLRWKILLGDAPVAVPLQSLRLRLRLEKYSYLQHVVTTMTLHHYPHPHR